MKAVILAAGESSRFKPLSDNHHKSLNRVLGKPILQHTVERLREVDVDEIIIVQGPEEDIEEQVERVDKFVVQEEPNGMGNALNQARDHLEGKFLILTPYRANALEFLESMINKSEHDDSDTVLVSTPTETPEKYGVLEFDEDSKAVDLVEKPSRDEAPSNMKVTGLYLLNDTFFAYLDDVDQKEYQYEEALSLQMDDKAASVVKIDKETNSIKYPWDLFAVLEELLECEEAQISDDASIADSAEIIGKVIIEDDVKVYENAVIKGPAYIGEGSTIGNNAVVRDNVSVERMCTIGANTEIKNSIVQPNSSIHSGFIGDSVIGSNTKIGAGVTVANRRFRDDSNMRPEISSDLIGKNYVKDTGRKFLGAIIGDNVDIGVDVSIMPGVQIGSNSTVGPKTLVAENVKNSEKVYQKPELNRK